MKRTCPLFLLLLLSCGLRAQSNHSDKENAIVLCAAEPISITVLNSAGDQQNEIAETSCTDYPYPETNSIWFTWKVDLSGSLAFTLLPVVATNDLDFVLFKRNSNEPNFNEIRCNTSGNILGESIVDLNACTGATGLSFNASDIAESPGCSAGNDNFLKSLMVSNGDEFLLFVNNYKAKNGFLLAFSGDCTFLDQEGKCNANLLLNEGVTDVKSSDKNIRFSDVYPNPSKTDIAINIESNFNSFGSIQIINISGHIVKEQNISLSEGNNTISVNINELHTGIWFIKAQIGTYSYVSRFDKY
jgi:hypothetical protein